MNLVFNRSKKFVLIAKRRLKIRDAIVKLERLTLPSSHLIIDKLDQQILKDFILNFLFTSYSSDCSWMYDPKHKMCHLSERDSQSRFESSLSLPPSLSRDSGLRRVDTFLAVQYIELTIRL